MNTARTRPVLVTGGCGFIGCNIADRLAARGDRVIVLDNLTRSGVRENAQWLKSRHGDRVKIVVADIRDPIAVIDTVREAMADVAGAIFAGDIRRDRPPHHPRQIPRHGEDGAALA